MKNIMAIFIWDYSRDLLIVTLENLNLICAKQFTHDSSSVNIWCEYITGEAPV